MTLTESQNQDLEQAARHHGTPHVRVKALALLNLGRGKSVSEVAAAFLVSRQSVYQWRSRFLDGGVSALEVRTGRGRRAQADPEELERYALQAPDNFGVRQARWTLQALANVVPSLRGFSPSGMKRALDRAGFGYKRGQPVQRSPDPDYAGEEDASSRRSGKCGPLPNVSCFSVRTD